MTSEDLIPEFKKLTDLCNSLTHMVTTFEGQLDYKNSQIQMAEAKLQALHLRLKEEEKQGGSIVSRASDEAAKMRNEAKVLLEDARKQMDECREMKKQALAAIADAEVRTKKLQADEQWLNNQVQIYERKKQALNSAMKA